MSDAMSDPVAAFLRVLDERPVCECCQAARSTTLRKSDGGWTAVCWACAGAPSRATHRADVPGAETAALAPRAAPTPRELRRRAVLDNRRPDAWDRGALPLVCAPRRGRRK
jgi:hypothetical protein